MFPLFLALLISSIARSSTCLNTCESVPSHVSSLVSLERAILCDEYNIQSLTESFFPANRRQAIIVMVNYYINATQHPLSLPPGERQDFHFEPDYVFFWFASSVLVFIEPRLLEGLALRTYAAEYNYAHIKIAAPFLYNDTNWITGLLSNATIWLKSYAERRLISITEGMTLDLQGFSTYKPDIDRDDYFVYNASAFNGLYVLFLGLSFSFIVAFICVASPVLILKYYKAISKLSMSDEHSDHVSFKFHNLFWGLIVSLGLALVAIYSFSISNIVTFGLRWDTDYFFIYPLLIAGLISVFVLGVIEALIVVHKISSADTLILLPALLLRIVGVSRIKSSSDGITMTSANLILVRGSAQRKVTIVWQFIGVLIVQNTIVFISFFSCGILMALFIDSVQVITTFAIYISVLLCLAHGFAALFEATDHVEKKTVTAKNMAVSNQHILSTRFGLYLKYFCIVVGLILMTLFICLFGFSFAYIVFFAGTTDGSLELFSSIGELLPVALASGIGWLLRREFMSYEKSSSNDGKDDNVMKTEPTTLSPQSRHNSKMTELETDFSTLHINQQQVQDSELT